MDSTKEFIEAVKKNDVDKLKSLLQDDITLVYARSDEDVSAFMLAVYYQKKAITKLLLEQGLTLDIFEAAAYGDLLRVAELLKDKPSLLNGYSSDGWTPLHLAAYFGNRKITELLLDLEADVLLRSKNPLQATALHSALSNKHWEVARLLIQKGADIHAATAGTLFTPLHYAVANGSLDIAKLLVSLGVDSGAKTNDGKTAIELAREKGHKEIANYLEQQIVD
jgi:ankyrin repeat protein